MKKVLGDNGLRLDPQATRDVSDARFKNEDSWFYEDKRGFWCVVEYETFNGACRKTKSFIIPKRAILEYARIAKSL